MPSVCLGNIEPLRIAAFKEELTESQSAGAVGLAEAQTSAIDFHHQRLLAEYAADAFRYRCRSQGKTILSGNEYGVFSWRLALAISVFFLFYRY